MTELTIGEPGVSTATADCVMIGTSLPTCSVAFLLSSTIRVGEETMLTSVTVLSASSTNLVLVALRKVVNVGNTGATAPETRSVNWKLVSRDWKNQRTPRFRSSLRRTSAMVASRNTWFGATSIRSRIWRTRRYS